MDVREKLVEQAISHFWYGISHDIFSEPVTTYAKLAIEALEKEKEGGVTVQEWKPISEPPKEKGTYLVCTDNGGVLLGHWYGTAWNAGGGANKHLAYWTEKPQPLKGE